MRILHVDTGRLWRGGQAQVFFLARGLQSLGHENIIICPRQSPLAARCRTEEIRVEPCEGRGDLSPSLARSVLKCVGEFNPHVLHVHTAHALAPLVVGRMKKVPGLVVSRRVSFPLTRLLSRWKYKRLPGRIIAVSGAIRDALLREGLTEDKVHVVHSGYDADLYSDLPTRTECRRKLRWPVGAQIVLFAGALAPHKSVPTLLQAFGKIVEEVPQGSLRLMIAGDGPLRLRVEEEIDKKGLSSHVELLGFRDDVPHLMTAADLIVLPSAEGEGSPAVIKEAMACGRAVVAASHGGVDEILEHEETGLLVTPGSISSLAGAMLRVLQDERLRTALGERAKGAVSRFDVRHMVEETEKVYRELVSGG